MIFFLLIILFIRLATTTLIVIIIALSGAIALLSSMLTSRYTNSISEGNAGELITIVFFVICIFMLMIQAIE